MGRTTSGRIRVFTNSMYSDRNAEYDYDAAGQLVDADSTATAHEQYTYDGNGNRTNTGYVSTADNRVLSDGHYGYRYDTAGNLVKRVVIDPVGEELLGATRVFVYDPRNRLVEVIDYETDINSQVGQASAGRYPDTL